jgi:hypothetical protein
MFIKVCVDSNGLGEHTEVINTDHIVLLQPNNKKEFGSVVHLVTGKYVFCEETVEELSEVVDAK